MKHLRAALLVAAPAALFVACAHVGSSNGSGQGAGGAAVACPPCQQDSDCAAGSRCGQFGGDTYCAPDCSGSATCSSDRSCTMVSGANGEQLQICIPNTNVCGGTSGGTGGASASSSASSSSGSPTVCGSLDGPTVTAACTSCKTSGQPCQANGCYGGWWCNVDTKTCQAPPSPSSCGTSSSSSSSTSASSSTSSSGSVGPTGGTLSTLSFAIVGDTRPANEDDTAGYPTAVITKIWQDIEAQSPRPAFAVSTGDYMFASPSHMPGTQATQLGAYLTARSAFSNIVFPAMGNHECDGATQDNCYACGSACSKVSGTCIGNLCQTPNYVAFLSKMLTPIGQALPYYTIDVNGTNNAWTAKFVFVACNMWSTTQATWLAGQLAKPTTYTFVVRHEGTDATTAPCLSGTGSNNADTIIGQYPHTLLIAGHTHTFAYYGSEKQIVVGNGGAPLTGSVNYGYVTAQQQASGVMLFKSFDYSTNAVTQSFNVNP